MTIQLYQFPTVPTVANLSTFCMKVETWLRIAGLQYETVYLADPRKAPYGKLPYIVDGADLVADSHNILEHLTKKYAVALDSRLSDERRAVALAFDRLLSDHLYWAGFIHPRWAEENGWRQIKPVFFGNFPPLVRNLVANLVRRDTLKSLRGHGLGRIPAQEVHRRAALDIEALAGQLGSQPYFMGDEPVSIDAAVYAALANIWDSGLDTPQKPVMAKYPNLVSYCERMGARYFPERVKK